MDNKPKDSEFSELRSVTLTRRQLTVIYNILVNERYPVEVGYVLFDILGQLDKVVVKAPAPQIQKPIISKKN